MQLALPLTDDRIESVSAAESLRRSAAAKRDAAKEISLAQAQLVLAAIIDSGVDGVTRHQIAERLQIPLSSVCGRVNELLHDVRPRIYVADFRRDGRSVLLYRG